MASASPKLKAHDFQHPYYPWDLKIKNYVPNKWSSEQLLGGWGIIVLVVILVGWFWSGKRKENFCFMRRVVVCWFLLCAVLNIFIEGYFAVRHATIAGESNFLAESWKEYAKGDSRYLTSDLIVVGMETFKAIVDGPLALFTFVAFVNGLNWRYAAQMLLSMCKLHGFILYLVTEFKDGFSHGPGHAAWNKPFYVYFLGLNVLSIVVPLFLIRDAWKHIADSQTDSDTYIEEYNQKIRKINKSHYH